MKALRLTCGCVLALLMCAAGYSDDAEPKKEERKVTTFKELRDKGIVEFLGREIWLKVKLGWEYAHAKIPEDPTPIKELQKKAGPVKIVFDGPDFKDVKRKKYLRVADSKELTKERGKDGKEGYVFKKKTLSNGEKEYLIKAKLKLRAMFNETHLKNPKFITQSNNPVYWNQTFELEILDVQDPEADKKPASEKKAPLKEKASK